MNHYSNLIERLFSDPPASTLQTHDQKPMIIDSFAGGGGASTGIERAQHIVNLSGGKDSQACALLAAQRGRPFRLVMADTGHEHPATIDHAHYVAEFVGAPLEIVRMDFTDRIAAKREFVALEWPKAGVPAERVERALEVLRPTGIPFLDLCIWKGRFPSRLAQFCTEFLKARAVEEQVIAPSLQCGHVVQWLGVRRDESQNRRHAQMFQRVRRAEPHGMLFFRPLIHWTAANVFRFSEAMGAKHNPLYMQGMGRVGCFPCINENKEGLRQIDRRFPEVKEALCEWEVLVADASKRGAATFFAADVTPEGAALAREVKRLADWRLRTDHRELLETGMEKERDRLLQKLRADLSAAAPWPTVDDVFAWSRTDRGGRQFNMLKRAFEADEGLSCSSQYGLCE